MMDVRVYGAFNGPVAGGEDTHDILTHPALPGLNIGVAMIPVKGQTPTDADPGQLSVFIDTERLGYVEGTVHDGNNEFHINGVPVMQVCLNDAVLHDLEPGGDPDKRHYMDRQTALNALAGSGADCYAAVSSHFGFTDEDINDAREKLEEPVVMSFSADECRCGHGRHMHDGYNHRGPCMMVGCRCDGLAYAVIEPEPVDAAAARKAWTEAVAAARPSASADEEASFRKLYDLPADVPLPPKLDDGEWRDQAPDERTPTSRGTMAAADALVEYRNHPGSDPDPDAAVADLIADLMHVVRFNGGTPRALVELAVRRYEEELPPEPDEFEFTMKVCIRGTSLGDAREDHERIATWMIERPSVLRVDGTPLRPVS